MKVPRYWQREQVQTESGDVTFGWGFSETSNEEARVRARETAQRVADWLGDGDKWDAELNQYGYDERLPREEIIREMTDSMGETNAFVSRNGYGSLILNTRDLVFIDVDLPPQRRQLPQGIVGTVLSLLGLGSQTAPASSPEVETLSRIESVAVRFSHLGFRVYRTANGFRIMVINEPLLSDSQIAQQLLMEFRADPLYIRMCKNQECFRARLTPKAWRCDVRRPPGRFPFENAGEEDRYRAWETEYNNGIRGFATCKLETTIGTPEVHPELQTLIELHDRLTGISDHLPLA